MAKALKIVGTIVAVVAIAASAIATGGATLGLSAGLISAAGTVAAVASVAGLAIGLASMAFKPPGFSGGGNPQNFTTNPQSGLPYCIGRTAMSGLRIKGDTTRSPGFSKFDDMLAFAVLLSAGGAIQSIDQFTADKEVVAFDGAGNATGRYVNYMGQKVSTAAAGASALVLSLNGAATPGWTSAHKLSGMTHALWMLRYDSKGNLYTGGVTEPRWVGKWVKVYDPRLDSTYPGGSGSCRALNEATYVWSRNPALHALTWCLGRWQNGQRTLGIGAPIASIRVGDFVSAANIADTNHWCAGGVTWSTESKWTVLKGMLQAGGAVPTMTGAMIGCRVFTPRVSIATIRSADLLDSLTIPAAKSRRERINTVIPRYRSEDHDWEIVSGTPVSVPAYVTADGGKRSREVDFPFVQNEVGQSGVDGVAQAGHLAAYEIVNAREAGPISFTTGPAFIGLKCGDCVTLDVPEEGLSSQKIVLTSDPAFDPSSGKITFAADTETDSKHTFALGQTSTPPPAFSLSTPDLIPPQPASGVWSLAHALGSDGLPLLRVAGASTQEGWDGVLVEYRRVGDTSWTLSGSYRDTGSVLVDITAVDGATAYEARVAYYNGSGVGPWRDLSAVTTDANLTADWPTVSGTGKPADNATRNDDTGNLLESPVKLDTYQQINATVTYEGIGGSGLVRDNWRLRLDGANAYCYLQAKPIPVFVGEKIFMNGAFYSGGGPGGNAYYGAHFYGADGTTFVANSDGEGIVHPGSTPAGWVERSGTMTVPSGAAYMKPYFSRDSGTGGSYYASELYLGRQQRGADKTSQNTAANVTTVGSTPATTVEAGGNKANNGLDASGNVLVDKVGTSAILDNSVISPASAFSSGSITIPLTTTPSSRTTLQTISVASVAGYTVALDFGAEVLVDITDPSGFYFADVYFELYRDTTRIYFSQAIHIEYASHTGDLIHMSLDDAPGTGVFTYTLEAYLAGAGCRAISYNRLIRAPRWKK